MNKIIKMVLCTTFAFNCCNAIGMQNANSVLLDTGLGANLQGLRNCILNSQFEMLNSSFSRAHALADRLKSTESES